MGKFIVLLSLALLFLVGCGSPKIDTSTDEKMKLSIEKIRQSLPKEKKDGFDEALRILTFNEVNLEDIFASGNFDAGVTGAKIKEAIHGKDGLGVIAAAEEVIKKQKEKEKVQALQEIKELEGKKVSMEEDKERLEKFKVLRSRFYKRKQEFLGEQPIIELTVWNGTMYAVSRAYFIGTLSSPDRSIPWLKESFNYVISGGLEPEEEAAWSLAPNMFDEWGTVNVPKNAIFTVEVVRLDGVNGKVLFSANRFTEDDRERLEELKEQLGK